MLGQTRKQVDDIVFANLASGADALGRLYRPPASEDREPHQQAAFGIGQQLVAPVDCRFERPMTRNSRPTVAHEQAKAIVQSIANLVHRENLTRAAASSMASGTPSRRRQISATTSAVSDVNTNGATVTRVR